MGNSSRMLDRKFNSTSGPKMLCIKWTRKHFSTNLVFSSIPNASTSIKCTFVGLWMLQQGEPAMYTDTVKLNPLIVCVDDQSHECSSGSSVCFQYSWKRNQYILYGIANHKRIREKIHEGNEISDCWLEKSRGWLLLLRWFVREISNRRDLCNSLHQE